jgi:TatD DNase family protein
VRGTLPLDTHTHIDVTIPTFELEALGATVFCMTRTLVEAEKALHREDKNAVWGVGCHPGLVGAQKTFNAARFSELIQQTALAGELGLDAKSRVPMELQVQTLRHALEVLQRQPRITSLHSLGAEELLLDELERTPIKGVILHWWLGDSLLTKRAVELGCFFSINASSARYTEILSAIPADRILAETDHPYGDKWSPPPRRPGNIKNVEIVLGRHYAVSSLEIRRLTWRNLGAIVKETGCYRLMPREIRVSLAAFY